MKTNEIINNLTTINVILCKRSDRSYYLGEDDIIKEHYYPEIRKHETDVKKWLISTIKYSHENSKLVIHTFSECIVNSLGHLIQAKKIPVDSVKIFIIDEATRDVIVSTYHEEGYLINWPYGWFMDDLGIIDNCEKLF